MELVSNIGIYKIVCLSTNKFYVGSSVDLKRRKFWHFCQLRNNKHANVHLQNAFNKYGSNSFNFSVIEFLPEEIDKQDVIEIEQKYINELDACNPKIGYNLCKIAGQPGLRTGFKHSEKTIELFSKQRKGKPKSEEFKETLSKMFKGKSMKERTNDSTWESPKKGKTMKEITGNPNWIDSRTGKKRPPKIAENLSKQRQGENNPYFNPEQVTLQNANGTTKSCTRLVWRKLYNVEVSKLLSGKSKSSKGWSLPS